MRTGPPLHRDPHFTAVIPTGFSHIARSLTTACDHDHALPLTLGCIFSIPDITRIEMTCVIGVAGSSFF